MGNNEPAVDQSDLRIRGSYGLNVRIVHSIIIRSEITTVEYGTRKNIQRSFNAEILHGEYQVGDE